MNKIEEAIEGQWGERCPDYEEGCPVCDAWREYDNLVMDNKLSNKLFLEELTHTRADPAIRAEMTKLIFRKEIEMTAMTKTQMVDACANYEVDWFFNQTLEEQKEVYRHLQLHGFEGFKNVSDENLFESCVHNGTFLMEE